MNVASLLFISWILTVDVLHTKLQNTVMITLNEICICFIVLSALNLNIVHPLSCFSGVKQQFGLSSFFFGQLSQLFATVWQGQV